MFATDEQAAAILSMAERRVVLADPGTGKTFTVVRVLADLIQRRNRDPECIAAVSFTRNAALELRERARDFMPARRTIGILFGTSTSLALQIVRADAVKLGFPSGRVTIYDERDQADVIGHLAKTMGLRASVKKVRQCLEDRRLGIPGETDRVVHRLAQAYEDRLRSWGAVDISGIIPLALRALRSSSALRSTWSRRCRYLLVDEAQDTAPIEVALYAALEPRQTVLVGDVNQAIYAFRGTTPDWLRDAAQANEAHDTFGETWPLTQGFRCADVIADAAGRVIAPNYQKDSPTLKGAPDVPGLVVRYRFESHQSQVHGVLEQIRRVTSTRGWSTAILARTNREADHWIRALRQAEIPCHRLATDRALYATEEVRNFHAWLRARWNPHDEVATWRVLRSWKERPPREQVYAARQVALESDRPLLEVLGWPALELDESLPAFATFAHLHISRPLADAALVNRLENVDRALRDLERVVERTESTDLGDFCDWLQRKELADLIGSKEDREGVAVGTVHAAKGLEWDAVIMVGLELGNFPNDRAPLDEDLGE